MTPQSVQSTNGRSNLVELPAGMPIDPQALLIRPIRDSDAVALQDAFEGLSATSRYFRFHSPLRYLSDRLAHYLTHVDGIDHVALVAIERSHRPGIGIGVARFVRDSKAPDTAEVAITVIDEAQHHGVARSLLEELGRAAQQRGIHAFTMLVLSGNHRVRRMLRQLGAVAIRSEGEVVHFQLLVSRLSADLPAA
jgi:GNAT superfamily N-acetyltransferase